MTPSAYLCEKLPARAADILRRYPNAEELRLRANRPASVTVADGNIVCREEVTEAELRQLLVSLSDGSLHAHESTLRQGFLTARFGIRVGVAGSVYDTDGRHSIPRVDSVCIRIPHPLKRICQPLIRRLEENRFRCGMLLCGEPGCGKTSLLRDLICTLASPPYNLRVAVVDSRGELRDGEQEEWGIADFLCGYSKADGIEIATRVLNPQLLVCDEIGAADDTDAILAAQNTGVPLVASAHASDFRSLQRRPSISSLLNAQIFPLRVAVQRNGTQLRFTDDPSSADCERRQAI